MGIFSRAPIAFLGLFLMASSALAMEKEYTIIDFNNQKFSLTKEQHEAFLTCQIYKEANTENQIGSKSHADFSDLQPYLTKQNLLQLAECLNNYHKCPICLEDLKSFKLHEIETSNCCGHHFCKKDIDILKEGKCPLCRYPVLLSTPINLVDLVKTVPLENVCTVFECANYLGAPKHILQALAHSAHPLLETINNSQRKQILNGFINSLLSIGNYADEYKWEQSINFLPYLDIGYIFHKNKIISFDGIEKFSPELRNKITQIEANNQLLEDFNIKKLLQLFPKLDTLNVNNNRIKILTKKYFDGIPNGFRIKVKQNPIESIEPGLFNAINAEDITIFITAPNELLQKAGLSQQTPEKTFLQFLKKIKIGKLDGCHYTGIGIAAGATVSTFMLNKVVMMHLHTSLGFSNYLIPAYYLLNGIGPLSVGVISLAASGLTFKNILDKDAPNRIRVYNGEKYESWYIFANLPTRLLAHLSGHLEPK